MSTALRRGIFGKLAGDTTLRNLLAAAPTGWSNNIWHNRAPQAATFPLVVFNKQAGTPTESYGKPAAMNTEVWSVRAIDHSDTADVAESIASRITTLLNDASLSLSGGTLTYLRRQSDIEYMELRDGETYQHIGALYRAAWS